MKSAAHIKALGPTWGAVGFFGDGSAAEMCRDFLVSILFVRVREGERESLLGAVRGTKSLLIGVSVSGWNERCTTPRLIYGAHDVV